MAVVKQVATVSVVLTVGSLQENTHGQESVVRGYQTGAGAEAISVSAVSEAEGVKMARERIANCEG